MNKNIVFVLTALLCGQFAMAQIPFKVLQGGPEVYTNSIEFIGQTDPSATVKVDGELVHVYRTGAFGKAVELVKGENYVAVDIELNGETLHEDVIINRVNQPASTSGGGSSYKYETVNYTALTTERANLTYGNGYDRLGASKMCFLEPGIPLKIVGQEGSRCKVQLSKNNFAYIQSSYIEKGGKHPGIINSGNITLKNAGATDNVFIYLPAKVAYSYWTELDPTTICLNLYGVMNNSNWIIHPTNLEMIDYVDARQLESDVLQIVIKLKSKFSWGFSVGYSGHSLLVKVKHKPSSSLAGLKIGIDAGHGGDNTGAVSLTGLKECDVNLDIATEVVRLLREKGATVLTSRPDTLFIAINDRNDFFKYNKVDMVVSIHNNAGGSALAPKGTSTYYKHLANRYLAECLIRRNLELEGVEDTGVVGNFNFALCAPTDYPAVLVEGLYMSSLADEELIADPEFRKRFAAQIVAGLEDYMRIVKSEKF